MIKVDTLAQEGDSPELATLVVKMVNTIRSMPDSELLKQPEQIALILAELAAYFMETGNPQASSTIELLYTIAQRIDAENKFPEVLIHAYRADFTFQASNQQLPQAKRLLLKELELVRKLEKTNTSMTQSFLLFNLAVLSAADHDEHAAKYLEESNKVFNGVTAATLSSELEDYWRMSILNQLQIAAREAGRDKQMASIFRNSSKSLYDAFKKLSSNKNSIPEFKELEVYAKKALQQQMKQE
jgi:hypothetical protein